MAPPNEGPSRYYKYGSVDDSEQATSHSSLLPTSSRSSTSTATIGRPGTVGGQQHPSQDTNTLLRDPEAGRRISRRLAVAVACGLAFLAGSGLSWTRSSGNWRAAAPPDGGFFEVGAHTGIPAPENRPTPSEPSSIFVGGDAHDAHDIAALEFTALNFYHVRDGKPGQDYPWLEDVKLIEPHRDTTLAVVGAREGFDYRWEVRAGSSSSDSGGVGEVQATATGAVTIVVLTQLDENVVVLEEVDGDGKVTNRLEETVMVKYVRREIRTLTDDEREELLDAMYQLWAVRVDGGNGKELYGEDYADIYAINRLHFKATTNGTCDHFHDGMGFLVSHSIITNTFEFSLQRVNPKLTVPYWDFTIETTAATDIAYDPRLPFTRTELLSPSWFGTADLKDNVVKDGRWAYTEIPNVKDGNPGLLEPDVYGKLRSPWNTNNRPYVSRSVGEQCQASADGYLTWPDCKVHYELVTTNHEFYSFVWDSMGGPHGPVHFWLGGNIDCDTTYNKIATLVGAEIAEIFAFLANGHRKGLFCDKVWGCNRTASVDEKPHELMASGTCGCQGYDLTQGDDYKIIMDLLSFAEFYIGEFSEDIQRQVVEIICSGVVNYGEHSQSSSSLDPMFWPMHGSMERMYQFAVVTGQVTEFTWPDKDMIVTLPDGTSYKQYVSSYYEECNGHHGSHIFPFGLLGSDTDGFKVKTGVRSNPATGNNLTNREVLSAFDPRSNSMNYVYDTFKWDHCVSEGYDFDDAWGEPAKSTRKEFFERQEPRSAVYTNFKRKMAELMKEEGDRLEEEAQGEESGGKASSGN